MRNRKGSALPVMEVVGTLQGEGAHTGRAACFIRLGGCDIGCHWCDIPSSWEASAFASWSVQRIVQQAQATALRCAVITGGEPLMYDLSALTKALKEAGFATHLETSGAYSLSGTWDWVCVSPKKNKAPLPALLTRADELKVVVYNRDDLKWASQNAKAISPHCKCFLQPEWSKRNYVLPLIHAFLNQHPTWRLSIQAHKFIGLP